LIDLIGDFKRFDLSRRPKRPWRALTPVTWLLSYPTAWARRARIDKTGMPKDLKPPFLLLCNHNSFMDFKIMTTAIFPHRANYIVAIDGFLGIEWLLRAVGGIGNRKFVRSYSLVKNMLHARDNGDIVVMFPEARYSLCGTFSVLPGSLGKMIRLMNIPVVTLIMHGHHINSPFWNVGSRGVSPVESEMKLFLTPEQIKQMTAEEINSKLGEAFAYDDFAWQKEKGIRVTKKTRAQGLHKVLYQCPSCKTEYKMSSHLSFLQCGQCSKQWEMTELGELRALGGETEFSHIPDWYMWQRGNVRKEVEDGTYSFSSEVRIESLPNSKGFKVFPEPGLLTHTSDGFTLTGSYEGTPFTLRWPVPTLYSCHIEYNYKGRGDCVDLNTENDTLYLFPKGDGFSVTKLSIATEELFTRVPSSSASN
jgi:transcription elongation factor Elf1